MEELDTVSPPTLPPDWLATNALGAPPLWVTSSSGLPMPSAFSPPNAAFVDDPSVVSDKRLDSRHVQILGTSPQLAFWQNFNLEASDVDPNLGFDGGVLEISFDGGNTFQDILVAGGTFVMGGYNRTISTDRGSPIAGRAAWSGNSEGFIITIVDLPFHVAPVVLRWRMASDNTGSGEGWRVDTFSFRWCEPVPCYPPTPRPSRRRHHAPCSPPRQALTLRPRLLRYLAQARDRRRVRIVGRLCQPRIGVHRMEPAGAERHGRAGRETERVKRPTATHRLATSLLSTPPLTRRSLSD